MCLQLVPCSLLLWTSQAFVCLGTHVPPAWRCSGLGQDGRETSGEGLALDLSGSEDRPSIWGLVPRLEGQFCHPSSSAGPLSPEPTPPTHTPTHLPYGICVYGTRHPWKMLAVLCHFSFSFCRCFLENFSFINTLLQRKKEFTKIRALPFIITFQSCILELTQN